MSNIGTLIDELRELREQKRALEEQVKSIEKEMADAESRLINRMDAEGVTRSAGTKGTVSVSELVKPTVEDWDAFYGYIHRNRLYHLLERRPSVTGCRELFETKGSIPGVVPFRQRRIRLVTKEQEK